MLTSLVREPESRFQRFLFTYGLNIKESTAERAFVCYGNERNRVAVRMAYNAKVNIPKITNPKYASLY